MVLATAKAAAAKGATAVLASRSEDALKRDGEFAVQAVSGKQAGSLWSAGKDGEVRGDERGIRPSVYTAAYVHPGMTVAIVGAIGALAGFTLIKKAK